MLTQLEPARRPGRRRPMPLVVLLVVLVQG